MIHLRFLILLFLFCQGILGQSKDAMVDMEKLYNSLSQKIRYDSIYKLNEKKLSDSLEVLADNLNEFIIKYYASSYIKTNEQRQAIGNKFIEQQIVFNNFKDSIPIKLDNYKFKYTQNLKKLIIKVITDYNKDAGFELIVDERSVLISSKNMIDITDTIFDKVHKQLAAHNNVYILLGVETLISERNIFVIDSLKYKDTNKALGYIDSLLSIDPNNATIIAKKGEIFNINNNTDLALFYYFKAINKDPNIMWINYNIGSIYYNLSVKFLEETDMNPKEYFESLTKAIPYMNLAKLFFEKACQIEPHNENIFKVIEMVDKRLRVADRY